MPGTGVVRTSQLPPRRASGASCAQNPRVRRPPAAGTAWNEEVTKKDLSIGTRPFTVAEGLEHGVGRGTLDGPLFERPFHGVRQWKENRANSAGEKRPRSIIERREFQKRCTQLAVRMGVDDFFSHTTALVLHGAPTPRDWDRAIHISGIRPRNPIRIRGVVSHRLGSREGAFTLRDGLRVEAPARTWVQASAPLPAIDLIVAADFLVARGRRFATIDELREEAARMRRPRLQRLIDRVREGAESSRETELRIQLVDGGLPEPELAFELFTANGTFLARLDQAYPRYRIGVEYDGRQHAEDPRQFERDADRWRAIGDEGWHLVRILNHHLEPNPAVAVDIVRRALLRAGWRP